MCKATRFNPFHNPIRRPPADIPFCGVVVRTSILYRNVFQKLLSLFTVNFRKEIKTAEVLWIRELSSKKRRAKKVLLPTAVKLELIRSLLCGTGHENDRCVIDGEACEEDFQTCGVRLTRSDW